MMHSPFYSETLCSFLNVLKTATNTYSYRCEWMETNDVGTTSWNLIPTQACNKLANFSSGLWTRPLLVADDRLQTVVVGSDTAVRLCLFELQCWPTCHSGSRRFCDRSVVLCRRRTAKNSGACESRLRPPKYTAVIKSFSLYGFMYINHWLYERCKSM